MTNGNTSRERILDTAFRLFQRYGYHAIGINQIIKESRCPKGSLYHYFPGGKEELAKCAIQRARLRIEGDIKRSMSFPGDAKAVFAEHLRDLARRVGEEGAHFSITMLALETMHVNEELRQECSASLNLMVRLYEEKLSSLGYDAKSAHELAVVIQCIVDGAITLSVVEQDMGFLEAAANQVERLL